MAQPRILGAYLRLAGRVHRRCIRRDHSALRYWKLAGSGHALDEQNDPDHGEGDREPGAGQHAQSDPPEPAREVPPRQREDAPLADAEARRRHRYSFPGSANR